MPVFLPASSNFAVDGRALRVDTVDGSDGGGGGRDDMSDRRELLDDRVFTLASGPSRKGDGHK